jgi:uncharacterized protein (TIGR03790 family)
MSNVNCREPGAGSLWVYTVATTPLCGSSGRAIGPPKESLPKARGFPGVSRGILYATACLLASPGAMGAGLAERVVIVANASDPDSLAIAAHYAGVRGVPLGNIITIPLPTVETVTWRQFVSTLWQPLEDQLVARGWIDAIPMDLYDGVGRRKYAVSGHRIAALILCRGVPLRIDHDPSLFTEVPPYTDHAQFRTNEGAVDSELSLLAQSDYPINASIPNPLFRNDRPTDFALAQVVKVSRLDGPTAAEAMHLVDLAVEAERTGLVGRAYVDIAGPHVNGNQWLEATASAIASTGMDMTVTRGPGTMPATARIDAPVLYFGWYAQDLNGPFALPGFRFPPGAIAVHIHSFSAHTLRSDSEGWCGPLLGRGVTATVGNVFEPYLEYLHRPDYLMEALARGEDLVDAAFYALPVLSWQSIVVGDPLYRPFAEGSDALRPRQASPLASYAVIRQMNLDDEAGRHGDAIKAGRAGMKASPSLALALALAMRLEAAGNKDEGIWMVKEAVDTADTGPTGWSLIHGAARFLATRSRSAEAVDVYRKLFDIEMLPRALKLDWLGEARLVALDAGDSAQAADWQQQAAEKPLAR